VIVLLPYIWMVSSSLKSEQAIFSRQFQLVPDPVAWSNYPQAWTGWPLGRWLLNSIIVAAIETASVLATSVLAGYAFARLRFHGRDALFLICLAAMMVPIQVTIVPSFLIVRWLGLTNTYLGIASLHFIQFFGIFLMRQFLLNLPVELEDAARIDGCNRLRVLAQIVLPLSGPALVALAIFAFTASWNNFLWPLVVVTTPEMMTIQIGLASMKGEVIRWGPMLAATTISAIPVAVVYMVLQRYFTQGIAMTGLKG
jgi:multiple sugar transport system permease protein